MNHFLISWIMTGEKQICLSHVWFIDEILLLISDWSCIISHTDSYISILTLLHHRKEWKSTTKKGKEKRKQSFFFLNTSTEWKHKIHQALTFNMFFRKPKKRSFRSFDRKIQSVLQILQKTSVLRFPCNCSRGAERAQIFMEKKSLQFYHTEDTKVTPAPHIYTCISCSYCFSWLFLVHHQ